MKKGVILSDSEEDVKPARRSGPRKPTKEDEELKKMMDIDDGATSSFLKLVRC